MISDVIVRPAGRKGKGVFALRALRAGEFISAAGTGASSRTRTSDRFLAGSADICELDFETSAILLPPGCYLNHSCDPNAMRSGVKVFAWRSIRPGEEITIDYRLNASSGQRSTCLCGSVNCSGEIISDFFSIEDARQRRYLPYAPDFIRREYRRRLKPAPGVGGRLRPGASSPD